MARPLRIEYEGAVYHVTSRGNAKKSIYRDDQDRTLFLNTLEKVNRRHNFICHAFCLMKNHYHLIIETPEGNLSKGMKQLNGTYTQIFNKKHKRAGHVFQGRYKAILVQKHSHLLEVCRYVVLNPVRARAAVKPDEWTWSSYKATAGLEKPDKCLTTDLILEQFAANRRKSQIKYREFVMSGIGEKIWSDLKGQCVLGEDDFAESVIDYIKRYNDVKEIPRSQRYVSRPSLEKIFLKVNFNNRGIRRKKVKEAVEKFGYSQKEVADYIGIHYSVVCRDLKM